MSADKEQRIILREVCETCSRPIFPSQSTISSLAAGRPGFCHCSSLQARPQSAEAKSSTAIGAAPDVASDAAAERRFDPNIRLLDLTEGGYQFLDRIGKGTLSYVYQARSGKVDALLAMKIFRRSPFENKRTLKRLEQEANKAKQLNHPNLCSVYEFGLSEKQYPYLVMDFLAGPTLEEVISTEGFLEVDRLIDIAIQICDALTHAHHHNLIHRDLKPANIYLLKAKGGGDFVKVSDFGIAKVLPNPGRETRYMTADGEEFGNPSYMSPEQCLGERLDGSSDIYSLGCLMYEALSGKLPFSSSNPVRLGFKQVSQKPQSLRERFKDIDVPEALDAVVLCALEKKPENRFPTAEKMKEALIAIQEGKKPKLPSKAVNTSKADKAESSALPKDKNWLNLFGLGQKNKNE
ncbi:MAG: serine/threonine-protein kinase [Candidatus Obscuribacterales bacterium]